MKDAWRQQPSPALLRLISEQLGKRFSVPQVQHLVSTFEDMATRELPVHLEQQTEIRLLNSFGDAEIRFRYKVANAGFLPLLTRTHQYWFEQPQGAVSFYCIGEKGVPFDFQIVRSAANYRELEISFPKALQALEQTTYEIGYIVTGNTRSHRFYYLSPRTLTKRIGLTVIGPHDFNFKNAYVTHESSDGFLRDDPPTITHADEGELQRIAWRCTGPKVGDLFRTFWCDHDVSQEQPVTGDGDTRRMSERNILVPRRCD
jgi:hypothetical protein